MVIILILLLLILFLFFISIKPDYLIELEKKGNNIISNSDYNGNFNLSLSKTKTYTLNNKDIYIVICDKTDKQFDDNTLIKVFIHELAHVIRGKSHESHDKEFREIERLLLISSEELGYYDSLKKIDKDYPCA